MESTNEQDLLVWFYPDQVKSLYRAEDQFSWQMLNRMGHDDFTPRHENYRFKGAHPVTLDQMIEDLSTAKLILFGKKFEKPDHVKKELEIVKRLASAGSKVTVASAIGHSPIM